MLIPVDGSDSAQDALEYAAENYSGDRLTVLHVVDPVNAIYGDMDGGYYSQDLFDQTLERGENCVIRHGNGFETLEFPNQQILRQRSKPAGQHERLSSTQRQRR